MDDPLPQDDKLEYLRAAPRARAKDPSKYSAFIKSLRVILPIIALGIIALLFSWNTFQNRNIEPIAAQETAQTPKSVGKNELLNPRFESVDDKNQPFMITATRALQSTGDEDLMILEAALGDIVMNDGGWIAVKAQQAAYTQTSQRLLLKGDVQMFYDDGYTMRTQELDVNMNASTAATQTPVQISGPAGLIDATGLNATGENERLIFTGPAKMTIFQKSGGTDLGKAMP